MREISFFIKNNLLNFWFSFMIRYHRENTKFALKEKRKYNNWIKTVVNHLSVVKPAKRIGDINVIFCSNSYILSINKQYLKHNYFTDIITFDYSDDIFINSDLFISIETVKTNSEKFKTEFSHELNRVLIHGILHLIGYNDKKEDEKSLMRLTEERALKLLVNG